MNNAMLHTFLDFKATKKDLITTYGEDLYNVEVEPMTVSASHVIVAIDKFSRNDIDAAALLDWVNVVWFTDLYEYPDNESDSISSVLSVLETLDEEGVALTENDLINMKKSLLKNQEFIYTP